MVDSLQAQHLLSISSMECSPLGPYRIVVRVKGRWTGRQRLSLARLQLVVESDGRENRFPIIPEPRTAIEEPGGWSSTFALPAWLESYLEGPTYLQIGTELVPVTKAAGGAVAERPQPVPSVNPAATRRGPADAATQLTARIRHLERSLAEARQEPSRLHELVAKAQADVGASIAQQERLETFCADLRDELGRVRAAFDREREERSQLAARFDELVGRVEELRFELAETTVSREATQHEVAGLRSELRRLGAELAAVRDRGDPSAGEIGEAEELLEQARTAAAITRRQRTTSATTSATTSEEG